MKITARLRPLRRLLRRVFLRPQILAFLPALMLGGYWFGGEGVLMIVAVTFPVLLMLGGLLAEDGEATQTDGLTGLATRDHLIERLDDALTDYAGPGQATVVIVLQIDGFDALADSLGGAGVELVLLRTADRITGAVRRGDVVARLVDHRFAVMLPPVRGQEMDVALRATERLQAAIAEPVSVGGAGVYVTASAGFCLARRAPDRRGAAMLEAAETALEEARRVGEGAIRAYAPEMGDRARHRHALERELAEAFEDGQIRPWFQPQISTDTGAVTGVEALARWDHPARGLLPPGEFLGPVEQAGLNERLGEVVLFHALSALRSWDRAGLGVPRVAVNFSAAELRNPKLVDRIRWELDRFDLAPERLTVEVLETVVARTGDDTITRNIADLATLGCRIDLDDFGTGHASIAHIRRFAVGRIKIDRSFVCRVDEDRQQQKMVAAILSMAERLEIETLAEGVETHGEHAMLAQLGCDHVQGYAIARPMPFDDTIPWLEARRSRIDAAPVLPRPGA
jgi:diguanylate cyclase (GGDEF)-like protein